MRSFGIDVLTGCYDDFEYVDTFVLRGSKIAGMRPTLWLRLTGTSQTNPCAEEQVLSTIVQRSFELADNAWSLYRTPIWRS